MSIWFTADTHFGEQPKARQRATGLSAQELDTLIERRWRETVAADDKVWHLGDVGDWRRLAGLPGTKHLIFGNNDKGRREITASGIFASTGTYAMMSEMAGEMYFVHDPANVAEPDNYVVVHGHLHALSLSEPDFISVSVDCRDWAPISLGDILAIALEAN